MLVTGLNGKQIRADLVSLRDAYELGRLARIWGKAFDCNPWPGHYEQRFHWQDGWGDADTGFKKSVVSRRKIC